MTHAKKLIEVALPLDAINFESAREKSIRHGHPSTLHLWWARRPLATARAMIFASLVDDPDDPAALPAFVEACRALPRLKNAILNDTPRQRLFDFIEILVKWESTANKEVLETARHLIQVATGGNPPPLLDPFAGGGTIPLEAQRLGLEAHASDLNPVAVMINKAQIEIPPRFYNQPPVNPTDQARTESADGWQGANGLAADVRYYGNWMRERAFERIGHLYPKLNGETVIAWIWARTVKSPNPAVNVDVPLVRSFELSKKKGRRTWVAVSFEPTGQDNPSHRMIYTVKREQDGDDPATIPDSTVHRRGGRCIVTGSPMPFQYIREEAKAGRMGAHMIAIVTEATNARGYHSPDQTHIDVAKDIHDSWRPNFDISHWPGRTNVVEYGMTQFDDLFTPRQLTALTTFSDLVAEARTVIHQDALAAGRADDDVPLRDGGTGARAYAEGVAVYLAFAVDRHAPYCNSLVTWHNSADFVRAVFARQALPMAWDYCDVNSFSQSTGCFEDNFDWIGKVLESTKIAVDSNSTINSEAVQQDAAVLHFPQSVAISTDPPYYDNIGYADLSDFFYVWMRRMLKDTYPTLFSTLLVPKEPELIASPYRHGGKEAANAHFENGLLQTFSSIRRYVTPDYPLTVYYAFKQQESDAEELADPDPDSDTDTVPVEVVPVTRASTGWETMLTGLIESGFAVVGTWPVRTEMGNRSVASGTNALASSIVLVCRPRPESATAISRREFTAALRRELPAALAALQSGNIAPVDLAQASIGPGMGIYSRHRNVLEADGTPMGIRTALALINHALDEYLAEQDGTIDPETRFAVAWFEQSGFEEGEFGRADVLARAKNISVADIVESGILRAQRGKARLIPPDEFDPGAWDPRQDRRPTVWEAAHYLINALNRHGEQGGALLMDRMPDEMAAEARNLAYRLYNICERKGWSAYALEYNKLVTSWGGIGEKMAGLRRDAESTGRGSQLELL